MKCIYMRELPRYSVNSIIYNQLQLFMWVEGYSGCLENQIIIPISLYARRQLVPVNYRQFNRFSPPLLGWWMRGKKHIKRMVIINPFLLNIFVVNSCKKFVSKGWWLLYFIEKMLRYLVFDHVDLYYFLYIRSVVLVQREATWKW